MSTTRVLQVVLQLVVQSAVGLVRAVDRDDAEHLVIVAAQHPRLDEPVPDDVVQTVGQVADPVAGLVGLGGGDLRQDAVEQRVTGRSRIGDHNVRVAGGEALLQHQVEEQGSAETQVEMRGVDQRPAG